MRRKPIRSDPPRCLGEGFTLLELTIVLFILGLLAALMAPSFKGFFSTTKAVEATSGLRQSIRVTQQRAANRGEIRHLVLDLERGVYYVPAPKKDRRTRRETYELRKRLPESFKFASVYFPEVEEFVDRDEARLEFFPDGTTQDTEILLAETDDSGREKWYHLVTIQGSTGHVSAHRKMRADEVNPSR